MGRRIKEVSKLAKKYGSQADVEALSTVVNEVTRFRDILNSEDREAIHDAMQDFWDANYWQQVDDVDRRVRLPKEIADMNKQIKRVEKLLVARKKALQTVNTVLGLNTAVFGETVRGVTLGETIKLAIPINLAVKLLPTLMSSGQEEFVARLGKASGIVIFFNGFSSAPQKLVASTRIQSPEGLIFRIKKDIIIPGSEIIRDKIVPGQVEAEVVADEQGSKYNIGLAEFQVPGFRGTPRFDSIYARSLAPFTGGGE